MMEVHSLSGQGELEDLLRILQPGRPNAEEVDLDFQSMDEETICKVKQYISKIKQNEKNSSPTVMKEIRKSSEKEQGGRMGKYASARMLCLKRVQNVNSCKMSHGDEVPLNLKDTIYDKESDFEESSPFSYRPLRTKKLAKRSIQKTTKEASQEVIYVDDSDSGDSYDMNLKKTVIRNKISLTKTYATIPELFNQMQEASRSRRSRVPLYGGPRWQEWRHRTSSSLIRIKGRVQRSQGREALVPMVLMPVLVRKRIPKAGNIHDVVNGVREVVEVGANRLETYFAVRAK